MSNVWLKIANVNKRDFKPYLSLKANIAPNQNRFTKENKLHANQQKQHLYYERLAINLKNNLFHLSSHYITIETY